MPLNPQAHKKIWLKFRNPDCEECPLHEEAQAVCLMGDGPVPCDFMVIGEAPGFREDEVERPFAGKAGQYLDRILAESGLDRDEMYVTNVVKCRPPENRTPSRAEIKTCRHYLDDEIGRVKPKFILLVGNSALSLIKKSGIMKHRGEVFQYGDSQVLPTVHPAAVLRNPRFEQLFKTDVGSFARLIRGEATPPGPRTILVRSKTSLAAACKAILLSKAVAYDLETSGFDDWAADAKIATVAVAVKPGLAFVIPISHPQSPWKRPDKVLASVANSLIYTGAKRIAHNAKFDDRWLNTFGSPVYADFDTMIAAHLLDENRFKGLKVLSQILLGVGAYAIDTKEIMTMPLKKVSRYNAKDADYTLRLYYAFRRELVSPGNERSLRIFMKLMMPASRTLTDVERVGLWVDPERLATRMIEVEQKLDKINRKLTKLCGVEANWNSTQQLSEILFGTLKMPLLELTPKGKPSTKESVLLQLRHREDTGGKVVQLILDWRKWFKYRSTYLENYEESRDATGRIHPNYKITGTVTGRLSSGKEEGAAGRGLNIQQVPRDSFIRSVIGAPPGWRFVEADFSQVELRVAAHISKDSTMSRLFQLDADIHLQTAVRILKKAPQDVTKEERKKAKAVNFGFLFGMGAKKFVLYARDNYDVEVSLEEAEQVRDRFFSEYAALRAWHQRQRRLVNRYQRVSSPIGRVRHLPDVLSEDEEVRAEAERQAINSPVQSMASDMMLLSMILLHEQMDPDEAKIVGSVHDSLLFEIREDCVEKWVPIIKETMENLPLKKKFGVQLTIPIKSDVTVGQHWSEGVPWAS